MAVVNQITNGPNKSDFMLSLSDGKVIRFMTSSAQEFGAIIFQVERVGDSYDSWNISAKSPYGIPKGWSWTGYYSTHSRSGVLTCF